MTFKVEQSGWYRTRDGRLANGVFNPTTNDLYGFIENITYCHIWGWEGSYIGSVPGDDLVEYLGKERPKQKKVVRMAPVLCHNSDGYWLSDEVYASEVTARVSQRLFIRWLIDTPYAIEVEVEG